MVQKSYRGGEGRNTSPNTADRPGPDRPKQPARPSQGIARTPRGEEQPIDKRRAQQVHKGPREPSDGEKAQREAARQQPPWPGEPAGHE